MEILQYKELIQTQVVLLPSPCSSQYVRLTDTFSFSVLPRAIVALVYNVLKAFMEMNSTMFDELTATYKSDRQR